MHYNYHRYYDPSIGRYITSDPIGILRDYSDPQLQIALEYGGLEETGFANEQLNHLYGYVGQNPVTGYDLFGLAPRMSERRDAKDLIHGTADLLDSTKCQWWPAACLFQCVRWRCTREDECGKLEVYFIGQGYPYISTLDYDPNKDENCVCDRTRARGQWGCPAGDR